MRLTPEQLDEIKAEAIERLQGYIRQLETNGPDVGFDFSTMDQADLRDEAETAFAQGDLLGALILDVVADQEYGDD